MKDKTEINEAQTQKKPNAAAKALANPLFRKRVIKDKKKYDRNRDKKVSIRERILDAIDESIYDHMHSEFSAEHKKNLDSLHRKISAAWKKHKSVSHPAWREADKNYRDYKSKHGLHQRNPD